MSGFRDDGDGDLEAGDADGEFGALARGRVLGEPAEPFLVHAVEVGFLEEDDGGADDAVEGGAGGLKDGGDVAEALASLLLDGVACDFAGGGVVGAGAGDEDEARGADGLAVGGRRGRGVGRADDVAGHEAPFSEGIWSHGCGWEDADCGAECFPGTHFRAGTRIGIRATRHFLGQEKSRYLTRLLHFCFGVHEAGVGFASLRGLENQAWAIVVFCDGPLSADEWRRGERRAFPFFVRRDAAMWLGCCGFPPFAHRTREEWGTPVRGEMRGWATRPPA